MLTAKHHIRHLKVYGELWDNLQLTAMFPFLGLLEKLTVKDKPRKSTTITDAFLPHLSRYCPHLITLSLPTLSLSRASHKKSSYLDSIIQHCHQLGELELSISHANQRAQHLIFESLVYCPILTKLCLYGKYEPDNDPTSHLDTNMILNIAKLNQLKEFAFLGYDIGMAPTIDMFFRTVDMTTLWPSLTSLKINSGTLLKDALMISFIESHPRIESLDLTRTPFSDATLDTMAAQLPCMTQLRIVENPVITLTGVIHFVRHCHHLKKVEFSCCIRLYPSLKGVTPYIRNGVVSLNLEEIKKLGQRDTDDE